MKKTILSLGLITLLGANAFASIYIKYYNKDSVKHTFKVKKDGQTTEVVFNASIGTKGVIETKCGDVEISDNAKIEIKDGCIKFVN